MREKILTIMEKNSRIDLADLAALLGESEIAVANEIADMEKEIGRNHLRLPYDDQLGQDRGGAGDCPDRGKGDAPEEYGI